MNNLRESDFLHEIEDGSDNLILTYILRIFQLSSFIGGAGHAVLSFLEKGLTPDTLLGTSFAIGAPIILEMVIRKMEQDHKDMYDRDTGVVED